MRRRRSAFTLVELLVVIGIIALLISILLPALNKARQAANKTACLSNLHNIGVSIMGYVVTSKGTLPDGINNAGTSSWWSELAQQMGNKYQAINNLGSTNPNGVIANGSADQIQSLTNAVSDSRLGVFHCKDARDTQPASLNNYSCHPLLMPDETKTYPAGFPETALVGQYRAPYKISRIQEPQQMVLIFDGTQCLVADLSATSGLAPVPIQTGDAAPCGYNLDSNRNSATTTATSPGTTYLLAGNGVDLGQSIDPGQNLDSQKDNVVGSPYKFANVRFRHSGNTVANALFVDGHAGSFTFKGSTSQVLGNKTDLLRRNLYVTSLP